MRAGTIVVWTTATAFGLAAAFAAWRLAPVSRDDALTVQVARGGGAVFEGFGDRESWGRWTVSETARIVLPDALPSPLRVTVSGHAFADNARLPIEIRAGAGAREFRIGPSPGAVAVVRLGEIGPDARALEFRLPRPTAPVELGLSPDRRRLGLALVSLRIERDGPAYPFHAALSQPGSGLRLEGFSEGESWGRWTDSDVASLVFQDPLPRDATLLLWAMAFGPNAQAPITIEAGGRRLATRIGPAMMPLRIDLVGLPDGTNRVTFFPPAPSAPAALGVGPDPRRLGVGIASVVALSRADAAFAATLVPDAPSEGGFVLSGLDRGRIDRFATIRAPQPLPREFVVEILGHNDNPPGADIEIFVGNKSERIRLGGALDVTRARLSGVPEDARTIYLRRPVGVREVRAIGAVRIVAPPLAAQSQ